MAKKETNFTFENKIQMIEIYLTEYIHRDTHMWSQIYRFFFSSLAIMLLPYLAGGLGLEIPEEFEPYKIVFPILGLVLALFFLYTALSLAKRFIAVSNKYNELTSSLPEELRRKNIKEMPLKFLNTSNLYITIIFMFLALVVLGLVLLFVCYK